MKLAAGLVISAALLVSFADAMEDFMPLNIPNPSAINKAPAKKDILPPIENGETLTNADTGIEGLSQEEGEDDDEKATNRGSITSPEQDSSKDIDDKKQSGTASSTEAQMNEHDEETSSKKVGMDQKVKKLNREAPHQDSGPDLPNEAPDEVNYEGEVQGRNFDDGMKDEADNIADVDENDGEEQVNTGTFGDEAQDGWGKEVHEDD